MTIMQYRYRFMLTIIWLMSSLTGFAQMENTLFHLHALPQSAHINPGKFLDYNVSITLPTSPSFNVFTTNTGFSLNDAVRFENNSAIILPTGISNSVIDNNVISLGANVSLFGLYIRGEKTAVNFHVTEHAEARFNYPKAFVDFIVKGNGHPDFLGKTVVLNPTFNFQHYREASLGFTRKVSDKLDIGANFRLLFGLGNINTENVQVSLFTSDEDNYPITLSATGNVSLSGVPLLLDSMYENEEDRESKYLLNTDNMGFAIDIGASYRLTDKVLLEASILNLGRLNWKSYNQHFNITENSSSYTFNGVDLLGIFQESEDDFEPFQETLDSLENAFSLDQYRNSQTFEDYSTGLPVQVNLGVRYELAKNLYWNGLFNSRFYKDEFVPTLSTSILKELGRVASVSLSYTTSKNSFNNLGFGFSFNTPFQLHIVSDNALTVLMFPKSAKSFNLRAGVNMVFGHHEHRKEKKGGSGEM